ncbi:VWA domain-containing protein [Wukongibacter baidiensis]|uniref:vWA domain-containing protein n=1 Tax=Wukongibacter baidiensis TaxID=1723361 RepID=UPI003D7F868C
MKCKGLLILVIFLILSSSLVSFAEEIEIENEKRNVILVLDSSNSINNAVVKKKQELVLRQLLNDIIPEDTKISYVSYNHKISKYSDFRIIKSDEEKQLFLNEIESIKNIGYSDFGLGLKKASEIMYKNNEEKPSNHLIFLISDGEISLPKNKDRTEADSKKDIDIVIEKFRRDYVPILSIDISSEEEELDILKSVSEKTRGLYYRDNGGEYNFTNETFKDFQNKLILNIPETIEKNETFKINAYFKDSDNEKIIDDNFYKKLDVQANLKSIKDSSNLPVKFLNDELSMDNKVQNSGEYTLNVEIKLNESTFLYDKKVYQIKNNRPESSWTQSITMPRSKEEKKYDLNNLFKDKDNDPLSFELIANNKEDLKLEGNSLHVSRDSLKELEFKIKAVDSEGASIITDPINVKVISIYKYYIFYIIGVLVLIISVIGFYIYKNFKIEKKKNFNGKVNAYFIRVKDSDEDIEPLTFYLYQYNRKKITLKELMKDAGIEIDNLELKDIYFKPYFDKSVLIVNNSKATMMINSKIIKKNENCVLDYKQKIHITFEDNYSELELHFRKI